MEIAVAIKLSAGHTQLDRASCHVHVGDPLSPKVESRSSGITDLEATDRRSTIDFKANASSPMTHSPTSSLPHSLSSSSSCQPLRTSAPESDPLKTARRHGEHSTHTHNNHHHLARATLTHLQPLLVSRQKIYVKERERERERETSRRQSIFPSTFASPSVSIATDHLGVDTQYPYLPPPPRRRRRRAVETPRRGCGPCDAETIQGQVNC